MSEVPPGQNPRTPTPLYLAPGPVVIPRPEPAFPNPESEHEPDTPPPPKKHPPKIELGKQWNKIRSPVLLPERLTLVSFCRIRPLFGVVSGCQSPAVSSHLPRWCEIVVFAN